MPKVPFLPEAASNFAAEFDDLFTVMTVLSIFFTALVFVLLLVFAIRYRRGSRYNRKMSSRSPLPLEIGLLTVPLLLGLGIFAWSAGPYSRLFGSPPADAMQVFVVGKQWMWHMQHPNGVRENNELHLPLGQPVKLTMISQDVIHSFFVPAFRVHRDVLPGRYTMVWFTPTREGRYPLLCSQYCGDQHSRMTGWVTVMKPADFQAWLQRGGNAGPGEHRTMEEAGQQLVDRFACMQCHGFAPARAPSLVGLYGATVRTEDGRSVVADDAYLRESIIDPNAKVVRGYQAIMPTFKDQVSESDVLSIIAFIKSLGNSAGRATSVPETGAATGAAPRPGAPGRAGAAQSNTGAANGR